jgi:hypothetical protein
MSSIALITLPIIIKLQFISKGVLVTLCTYSVTTSCAPLIPILKLHLLKF